MLCMLGEAVVRGLIDCIYKENLDKETYSLNWNINAIGSDIHISVYDKRNDFLSLILHGWVLTFLDSHRTVFTFRIWLDFAIY